MLKKLLLTIGLFSSLLFCGTVKGQVINPSGGSGSGSAPTWTRMGTVMGTPLAPVTTTQEISCWIQTSPQILSTNYTQVVACLHTDGPNADDIYYEEAPTPLGPFTKYSQNPVIPTAGCASNVLSISGQLVVFACKSRLDIERYHSTNNGLTWTDDGTEISHGAGWKAGYVNNPMVLIVGSTCHMWFEGATTGSPPYQLSQGHATGSSTCGHGTFVEDAGDPVIPVSEFNGGGPFVYYDGVNFWEWEHGTPGVLVTPIPPTCISLS